MFFIFNSVLFANFITFSRFGIHLKNNPVIFIGFCLGLIFNSIFLFTQYFLLHFFILLLLLFPFFISFLDELRLPLLEEIKEIVYRKEDSQEEK